MQQDRRRNILKTHKSLSSSQIRSRVRIISGQNPTGEFKYELYRQKCSLPCICPISSLDRKAPSDWQERCACFSRTSFSEPLYLHETGGKKLCQLCYHEVMCKQRMCLIISYSFLFLSYFLFLSLFLAVNTFKTDADTARQVAVFLIGKTQHSAKYCFFI